MSKLVSPTSKEAQPLKKMYLLLYFKLRFSKTLLFFKFSAVTRQQIKSQMSYSSEPLSPLGAERTRPPEAAALPLSVSPGS